jgi:hypothetical protein
MTTGQQEAWQEHPPAERHPWHRFVALGDSYTEGIGDPERQSIGGFRGWADRAAEELARGQRDFAYANLAVRGMVLQEIIDGQLAPALALRPDLVAMSGGGNDVVFRRGDPDKLAEKMDQAVGVLAETGATIMLFAGPDWGGTPVLGQIRGRLAIYNEHLHTIGMRHHAVMIDLWCLPGSMTPGCGTGTACTCRPWGITWLPLPPSTRSRCRIRSSPCSRGRFRHMAGPRPGPKT